MQARPEAHDFGAGAAAPVGFAPAAVRRAVSSRLLVGSGAEVGIGAVEASLTEPMKIVSWNTDGTYAEINARYFPFSIY